MKYMYVCVLMPTLFTRLEFGQGFTANRGKCIPIFYLHNFSRMICKLVISRVDVYVTVVL